MVFVGDVGTLRVAWDAGTRWKGNKRKSAPPTHTFPPNALLTAPSLVRPTPIHSTTSPPRPARSSSDDKNPQTRSLTRVRSLSPEPD